jgi:AraC family transcriptional regulator
MREKTMEEANTRQRYVRSVSGKLVSSRITDTGALRIEMLKRTSRPKLQWHFRQPGLALFWFRKGCATLRGTVDGRPITRSFKASGNLAFFPASVEIEGELDVDPELDYAVVFLDPDFARERLKYELESTQVAFTHNMLTRGLEELCREAAAPDNVFELFAEGWADQALAHIFRAIRGGELERKPLRNPLSSSSRNMRRIEEYVRDNLAERLSLAAMSSVVGLSKRHFLRAFKEATGTTPHRFVLRVRIEEAKRRLIETNEAVTEVAFGSGFGSSQRFATSFRSATGVTPSTFRLHHSA